METITNTGSDERENWWNSVVNNLKEALTKLSLIPTVWSEEYIRHVVDRHDKWSLTPWSKALSSAPDWLFDNILNKVDKEYQKLIDQEWNPGRRVFVVRSSEPVWTNAIFPMENLSQDSIFVSHRDIWNEYINNWNGQEIKCSLICVDDMPTTDLIHVIMWPYGPTGKAGIYTMIFWDEWTPFPKDLDDTATKEQIENNEKCREYWNNHVMLVTPEELKNIIELKKEHGMPTEVEEQALRDFEENNKKSPIQKAFIPESTPWAIEIDMNKK